VWGKGIEKGMPDNVKNILIQISNKIVIMSYIMYVCNYNNPINSEFGIFFLISLKRILLIYALSMQRISM